MHSLRNREKQIEYASQDERMKEAQIIIKSPYGRAIHSAAILSRKLELDIRAETNLYEWQADAVDFSFLPQEEAERRYRELTEYHGEHPGEKVCGWESANQMKQRVFAVLERYKAYDCVIVCCHRTLMQYVLDTLHPDNGKIVKYECQIRAQIRAIA